MTLEPPLLPEATLSDFGLRAGQPVRFRRRPDQQWRAATVLRLERDGSIGLRDPHGGWRSIPAELVEVETASSRGARRWEAVRDRAGQPHQLDLF